MNRSMMLNSLNVEATDRISILLRDTVLLLCRNGFNFQLDIKVQGLIAITLDEKEVYLVKFDESACKTPSNSEDVKHDDDISCEAIPNNQQLRRHVKRRKSSRLQGHISLPRTGFEAEEERLEQQQHDFNSMRTNPDHDPPPIDNPFNPLTSDLQKGPIVDIEDSSTVSIKEEEGVHFDLTTFNDNDIINSNNNNIDDNFIRNQLPVLGPGMIGMGDSNHGNDMLWPMPMMNVSGRGRRARRSGQKMYSCEHPGCGLSFYRSYTLYRHQRLKHGQRLVPSGHIHNKNNPIFKCPVQGCGQIFMRVSNLERHTRDNHQHNDHLMNHENFLAKSELERYEESDLLFEGIDYGLSSR